LTFFVPSLSVIFLDGELRSSERRLWNALLMIRGINRLERAEWDECMDGVTSGSWGEPIAVGDEETCSPITEDCRIVEDADRFDRYEWDRESRFGVRSLVTGAVFGGAGDISGTSTEAEVRDWPIKTDHLRRRRTLGSLGGSLVGTFE
jgi:hypothetical protein